MKGRVSTSGRGQEVRGRAATVGHRDTTDHPGPLTAPVRAGHVADRIADIEAGPADRTAVAVVGEAVHNAAMSARRCCCCSPRSRCTVTS